MSDIERLEDTSTSTANGYPFATAKCNAVLPLESLISVFAPFCNNKQSTFMCPAAAATIKAVRFRNLLSIETCRWQSLSMYWSDSRLSLVTYFAAFQNRFDLIDIT